MRYATVTKSVLLLYVQETFKYLLFLRSSCVTMFFYGLLIRNTQLIVVNAVGFILQACYLVVYLFYSNNKVRKLGATR